ncbi:MAG TPA: hypothetical protein VGD17_05015, partial [Chitinophagaceae bacterium]
VQNVTLKGAGTPTAAGTNNFTVTASASTCNFPVTVIAAPVTTVNSWSFTQGTRNFSGTLPFGSDFGIDALSIGKALEMNGEIPNTDTAIFIYIQFPSSATAPVPGTYTTNPDWGSNNLTDFYFYDFSEDIYYVKDFPPLPPTTPVLTFTVTSYDATTKIVKGTFTGNAWNSVGTIVPITNGKFEAVVNF